MLRLPHRLYESRLSRQVRCGPIPKHLGIVLDGDRRRWSEQWPDDSQESDALDSRKLDEVLEWCAELAIPAVTLWVLSSGERSRPAAKATGTLAALEEKLLAFAKDPQIRRRWIRLRASGRLELLPASTAAAIRAARAATASHGGMTLTIAVAGDGRDEIVDAVRAVLAEHTRKSSSLDEARSQITTAAISRRLRAVAGTDADLVICTTREIRLSGRLLWQGASGQYCLSDVRWPALRRIDFLRAVRSFQDRSHGLER